MEYNDIFPQISGVLIPWYEKNKRDLPWRKDRDPYHIWISEIMLQQTRVEAVKAYYTRFLEVLPTVEALANVDDDLLNKLWEGLGYYSRVRNMKKAAQQIVALHDGVFPGEYEKILDLPGIGAYTAGAICSIAYNLPIPAVDGNVLRVVSRLTNDATPIDLPGYKKWVTERLARIYPKQAGDFTQALMELGATVCGPNRKPDCSICPCKGFCLGYRMGTADKLPVKLPKRAKRVEEITVFILSCGGMYALEKRPAKGLLAGLWQFPNTTGCLSSQEALAYLSDRGMHPSELRLQLDRKHIFTHIQWDMRGYYIELSQPDPTYHWFTAEQVESQTALPTAFRQFWDDRPTFTDTAVI